MRFVPHDSMHSDSDNAGGRDGSAISGNMMETTDPVTTQSHDNGQLPQDGQRNGRRHTSVRIAKHSSRSPSPEPGRKVPYQMSSSEDVSSLDDTSSASSCFTSDLIPSANVYKSAQDFAQHDVAIPNMAQTPGILKITGHNEALEMAYGSHNNRWSSKSVEFDNVTIYSHSIIMGYNPAVSYGPPIELDWTCIGKRTMSINERAEELPSPRCLPELQLAHGDREHMLHKLGYSHEDIRKRALWIQYMHEARREHFESLINERDNDSRLQDVAARRRPPLLFRCLCLRGCYDPKPDDVES